MDLAKRDTSAADAPGASFEESRRHCFVALKSILMLFLKECVLERSASNISFTQTTTNWHLTDWLMSNKRLLVEYLSNRRPGEEIVFSEIRSVLDWSDSAIVAMMEDMGLGKQFFINV
jgi:hypothetical protein